MTQRKTPSQGNIYPFPIDAYNEPGTVNLPFSYKTLGSLAMAIGRALSISLHSDELVHWFKFGRKLDTNFDVIVEWLKQEISSSPIGSTEMSFDHVCEKFHSELKKVAHDLGMAV